MNVAKTFFITVYMKVGGGGALFTDSKSDTASKIPIYNESH